MSAKREKIDPHVLNRYEVGHVIGKGAYGIVWKAVDKKTMSTIALKKIFDGFQNITDAQRTYREVMILQNLRHRNIVKLLNVIRAENHVDLYLAFEHVETDLHAVIRANILEDIHKKYIIYQLLKVLKYLHSADIIHRDIKPSNLLLNSECFMKLADFGLARMVDPINNFYEEPILTDYVATRWYRAPEILLGSTKYSKGVDIWSVGCILGELLNGKPLFPGSSTVDQLTRVVEVTGRPSREDLNDCDSVYAESMMQNIVVRKRRTYHQIFPNCRDPDAIDLMEKLLDFSPVRRYTAEDALEHPYVAIFHNPDEEPECDRQINLLMNENKKATIDQYRESLYGHLRNRRRKKLRRMEQDAAAAAGVQMNPNRQRRGTRGPRSRASSRHNRTRPRHASHSGPSHARPSADQTPATSYYDQAPRLHPVRGASRPGSSHQSSAAAAAAASSSSGSSGYGSTGGKTRYPGYGSSQTQHQGMGGGSYREDSDTPTIPARSNRSDPTVTGSVQSQSQSRYAARRNGTGGMALRPRRHSRRLAPITSKQLTGRSIQGRGGGGL